MGVLAQEFLAKFMVTCACQSTKENQLIRFKAFKVCLFRQLSEIQNKVCEFLVLWLRAHKEVMPAIDKWVCEKKFFLK